MENYLDFVIYCKENIHEFNPNNLVEPHKNTDIPHSDFEVSLVMFLLQKDRPEQQEFLCPYWNKIRKITLNQWTGRVYKRIAFNYLKTGGIIYLGQDENKNHFFYDSSDDVLVYYTDLNTDELIAEQKFEFIIQSNIYVPPVKLDLKFAVNDMQRLRTPRKKKISRIRDFLFDCEIECSDGCVKANRWHLCMLNDFFYTYISRYSNSNERLYLKEFSSNVLQEYLNFSLEPNDVNKTIIYENPTETLKLGMFLQDYKFVKYVYDLISPECNEESLENLNEEMKEFFHLTIKGVYHQNNKHCKISKMLF